MIDPDDPRPKREHRFLIAFICIAAACGLGYSAFSHRWLENKKSRVGFSLLSSERCVDSVCESKSNTKLMEELTMQRAEDASRAFALSGQATLGLLAISALALLVCAWKLVLKKRTKGPSGPQHAALGALAFALIGATVFIKLKPGGATVDTGVAAGPGFWAFGIACVLGIIGAQAASGLIKPVDENALS
ncbi:MAG TPA: hypothetical protein VL326_38120 [Kofleriaceae bacterium]|jgi:hypothetical protein|nr:hypothetical protein [Kofleriaceae bacterium]